jgi:hypothetical protein
MSGLPPGFVLDSSPTAVPKRGLPQGFVLDAPAATAAEPAPLGPETTNPLQASGYGMEGVSNGLGGTLSLPNELLRAIFSAGPNLYNAIGHPGMERPAAQPDWLSAIPDAGNSYREIKTALGADLPAPNNLVDKLASSTGTAVGSALVPALGEASVAAQPLRTLGSELATAAGAGLGGGAAEQIAPDSPYAELIGQIMGSGATGLVKAGVKKAITPFPATPERISAADTMEANGVNLTAGQRTGNKGLQYAESELGGATAAGINDTQGEQFTKAVLSKAGINADRATPPVIDEAFNRIGAEFDHLAAKTAVPLDQQLQNDMLQVAADYQSVSGAPAKVVEDMVNRAGELAAQNGGVLAGQAYQNLRSKIGEYSRRADGPTQMALRDLQDALDDAVERHMPPDSMAEWQQARREYKNMLVIEKAATAGGENAALGIISPAQLRMATVNQNRRAYARGTGDFNDLAHAGSATMTPLPQSGTAPRTAVRALGASLPAVIGAAAGSPGGPLGTIAGAAVGAATPYVAGKVMLSPVGRKYLGNQVLEPRSPTDLRGAAQFSVELPTLLDAIMRGGKP